MHAQRETQTQVTHSAGLPPGYYFSQEMKQTPSNVHNRVLNHAQP